MADIPGNLTTPSFLRLDGTVNGSIEQPFDQDWFLVSLAAGVTYNINVLSSGSSPLADPLVRLLDENGIELARNDDIGGGSLNSHLEFTASTTGAYYISAQAFSSYVGDYELLFGEFDIAADNTTTALLATDGFAKGHLSYIQFNDPLSGQLVTRVDADRFKVYLDAGELYKFVWGKGTDGASGVDLALYDPNGNLAYKVQNPGDWTESWITWTPGQSGYWYVGVDSPDTSGEYTLAVNHITNSPLESIDAGTKVTSHHVDVYFAHRGETFDGTTSEGWNGFEIGQMIAALAEYSKFANLTFVRTAVQADAEFTMVRDNDELDQDGVLGSFGPPGFEGAGEGVGKFNGIYRGWSSAPGGGNDKGGFSWGVLLHEIGHGLGMAHPHDDGYASVIMNGVADRDSYGAYDLNQCIFSVMSYNDGWPRAPQGVPKLPDGKLDARYGWMATPAALDIALLQQKYGMVAYRGGNDTYTLPVNNGSGTFYSCIWDTGGEDTIQAAATSIACTIDLRAATLRYEAGGGGRVSYHSGIFGGFTIANGVDIENAAGGGGRDMLTGNDAANVLDGLGGADTLTGLGGSDGYRIDSLDDIVDETFAGSSGTDTVVSANISIQLAATARFKGAIENAVLLGGSSLNLGGNSLKNMLTGNAGNNTINGQADADIMRGLGGNDTYVVDSSADIVDEDRAGSTGEDLVTSSTVSINLGNGVRFLGAIEDVTLSGGNSLNVFGNVLSNKLTGNQGSNIIDGGQGADTLSGLAGNDTFRFSTVPRAANVDAVLDYDVVQDRIELFAQAFGNLPGGPLASRSFFAGPAAHDLDDRIVYNSANGFLSFDADGNKAGGVAAIQFATLAPGLAMSAGEFFAI